MGQFPRGGADSQLGWARRVGRETAALDRDATVTTQAEPQVLPTPPWTVLGLGQEGRSKSLGLGLTWGGESLANSCFLFAKAHNLYLGIKKTTKTSNSSLS